MNILENLVSARRRLDVVKYCVVATRTVLLYDILVNLDYEIRYIWTKPWSLVRFLYHFNRVWPVLLLGMTTATFFLDSPSAQTLVLAMQWPQMISLPPLLLA
ncbi:hypothetical protein FRC08_014006 [Ceratobasidium sp. 394]|nr:hypothetical protein FRC08_014006 [Ceratobasidium sp. 394]